MKWCMRVLSYFPQNRDRPGDFAPRRDSVEGQINKDGRDSEENMPPECAIYFTICRNKYLSATYNAI